MRERREVAGWRWMMMTMSCLIDANRVFDSVLFLSLFVFILLLVIVKGVICD